MCTHIYVADGRTPYEGFTAGIRREQDVRYGIGFKKAYSKRRTRVRKTFSN